MNKNNTDKSYSWKNWIIKKLLSNDSTKEDILNSLKELNVSCKNVAFKIFGLSLTTYNILVSILMLLLSIKIYTFKNGIKK